MTVPGIEEIALPAVLVVAGAASALVVALALAAFRRRRSRPYLLVTVALAALLARTVSGVLSHNGVLGREVHHVVEHGLDAVVVVLLLGAVYFARSVDRPEEVTRE